MANWVGTSRSNYFRVKDEYDFLKFADDTGVKLLTGDQNRYAVVGNDGGYWPATIFKQYEDGSAEYVDIDFVAELASHLADGEVAILVTAGAEKLRYVTGYAVAVKNDGSRMTVDINNIYNMVLKTWDINTSRAEY